MKKTYFTILLIIFSLTAGASAAIITVNSAGVADQTTVSAAITAAVAGDTINIIGGGPYDELISITKPLTLQGFGYRPVVCLQQNSGSIVANAGLQINADGVVNINNITFLPSLTSAPAGAGILIDATSVSTCVANLNNILLCPNDGTNQPVTTDGLSKVDVSADTCFLHPVIAARAGAIANLTDVIITNNNASYAPQRTDGYLNYSTGGFSTIGEGCIISYNGGFACQINNSMQIQGSDAKPVRIMGNCQFNQSYGALTFLQVGSGSKFMTIDHCIFDGNLADGIHTESTLFNIDTISNSIFSNNAFTGINTNTIPGNMVLENVTFSNNSSGAMNIAATNQAIAASNIIFAGTGDQVNSTNAIQFSGSTIDIQYSAIVQSGAYSLTTIGNGISGTGVVNQTAVITADPGFASTDPLNPNFLDVTNYAYGTAGVGGQPISGGADFIGIPLVLSAGDTTIVSLGATKDFSATGGIGSYTWALSNDTVGFISATTGSSVTFTASSIGEVVLTLTDAGPPSQQKTTTILVLPTSAPLFINAMESKEVRFEIFE